MALWAMGYGLWAVGCGLWAVGCGLWAMSMEKSCSVTGVASSPERIAYDQ